RATAAAAGPGARATRAATTATAATGGPVATALGTTRAGPVALAVAGVGQALGQRRGAAPGLGLLLGDFALHLLELGGRDAVGVELGEAPGTTAHALAAGLDIGPGGRVGGDEAAVGLDALAAVAIDRLALLPMGEHRGGDEDRRVGAGGHPDEQREGEVLERGAAEQQQGQDR